MSNAANRTSNRTVALVCLTIVGGMLGLSYAAVPLYRIFCQVTGFGGTTQRADSCCPSANASYAPRARTMLAYAWAARKTKMATKIKVGIEATRPTSPKTMATPCPTLAAMSVAFV